MNCYKCVSREVCFLQKQIESLTKQATDSPFYPKVDTEATRTLAMGERFRKRMERKENMECELKGIIAYYCPFYINKIQKQEKTNATR